MSGLEGSERFLQASLEAIGEVLICTALRGQSTVALNSCEPEKSFGEPLYTFG